jgi:antitoxin component of RelBE/YafQ-DinJ toxin-antitoxin module
MPDIQVLIPVDRSLRRRSDAVLRSPGLDFGSFVTMALTQLANRRGLPFAVSQPDSEYCASEYGLTSKQCVIAGRAMRREASRARRAGQLRVIL